MIQRFSSRRGSLYGEFLKRRLAGATRYDRIAGYVQSSLLELASETLASIPRIRIVCNTEVSAEDVKTARMATGARRKEFEEGLLRLAWNAGHFPHLVDVHGAPAQQRLNVLHDDFVRDGLHGNGADRAGNARWRRLTEERAGSAKSVFHFDVPGQVAKSTHAGIPWLLYLRRQLGERVHFWPFDGWQIPAGRSALVEVYPALWKHAYAVNGRTADQHDAYSVTAWLRQADGNGQLGKFLNPQLTPPQRTVAQVEGWILGVG